MNFETNGLVTVATVCLNAADLLQATIKSVLGQTYANIEYIVVDGASTDGTIDLISSYGEKISSFVSEPDHGMYFAMNKAIELANGEYILFLNAGDTFANKNVVSHVMTHRKENSDLIYGDHFRIDTARPTKAKPKDKWYRSMPFCHQTLFTRTTLAKRYPFDTTYRIAADHDFVIRMYELGYNFHYLERDIACYLGGGLSQKEPFVACIESLNILIHSRAPREDIEISWWYWLLKKELHKQLQQSHIEAQEKLKKSHNKAQENLQQSHNEAQKKLQKSHIEAQEKLQRSHNDTKKKLQRSRDEAQDKWKQYHSAIQDLAKVRFFRNPIRKLKRYKAILRLYHSMK